MDAERASKKLRKPYTITKMRDRWSDEEHERFLDGLLLFGRDWKKIEDFVGTKTVIQIRSHAQKYFLKVQKNGLLAHVPPPRPKRNHAYPYPPKFPEDDMLPLQTSMVCPSSSSCFIPPQCGTWGDKPMLIDYTSSNEPKSSDYQSFLPGFEGIHNQKLSWTGSSNNSLMIHDMGDRGNQQSYPVLPNFPEVYNLIATIFDPEVTNSFECYMQRLKEMDPITAKTALVLMKNLAINLASPEFEPLLQWLSTYNPDSKSKGETMDADPSPNQMYSLLSQCAGYLPMP